VLEEHIRMVDAERHIEEHLGRRDAVWTLPRVADE
jgi:hypothetical protein